jgi:hypothetical protein
MSLDAAARFGEVKVMLPANANRMHAAPLIAAMRDAMSDFGPEDSLIAVGDPTLIAAATLIAARRTGGRVRLLKWDRMVKDYIPVEVHA